MCGIKMRAWLMSEQKQALTQWTVFSHFVYNVKHYKQSCFFRFKYYFLALTNKLLILQKEGTKKQRFLVETQKKNIEFFSFKTLCTFQQGTSLAIIKGTFQHSVSVNGEGLKLRIQSKEILFALGKPLVDSLIKQTIKLSYVAKMLLQRLFKQLFIFADAPTKINACKQWGIPKWQIQLGAIQKLGSQGRAKVKKYIVGAHCMKGLQW